MASKIHTNIYDCAILVVDDAEFNRSLITAMLRHAGFARISHAVNGLEALQRIAESPPDLIILDIMMPGIDGFEVCRRLRDDLAYADLPILVQTALSNTEDRNRAFANGTTDLITKPIDRNELVARVRIHLENRCLIRDLQIYRTRLEAELSLAQEMFDHLLPDPGFVDTLCRGCGIRLRSVTRFGSDLGGTLWGLTALPAGGIGLWLLEMGGSGVTMALNAFRMHTLIDDRLAAAGDPAALLDEVRKGAGELLGPDDSAAVAFVHVEPDGGITLAASGDNPPLVRRAAGGIISCEGRIDAALAGTGTTIHLDGGEWLLLYNGDILSGWGDDPPEIRHRRWMALVDQAAGASPASDGSLSRIIEGWEAAGGVAADNDVCLLLLERP